MRKLLTIFFFIISFIVPAREVKDTTKIKLNLSHLENKMQADIIKNKKSSYFFDGKYIHLLFDSDYVDTVGVGLYHAASLLHLRTDYYLVLPSKEKVEILIDCFHMSLILMVICGEDIYIYRN